MMINRVTGGMAGPIEPARTGVAAAAFKVSTSQDASRMAAIPPAAAPDGLLLLQEVDDAPARDRRARQHGRVMLLALAKIQLGLLGDEADDAALAELAALTEQCPVASDPALRDVLDGVALRARLELAKRKV